MMAIVALLLTLIGAPSTPSTIAVYVGQHLNGDGFADVVPGLADTINDIKDRVRQRHKWRLVDKAADADVVLEVLSRGIETINDGQLTLTLPSNQGVLRRPANTDYKIIEADVRVRDHHAPLRTPQPGDHPTSWKNSAERITKQMEDWINTNLDAILAAKK